MSGMNCTRCGPGKTADQMAKNSRRGVPVQTLCKLCVSEQAKYSVRQNISFPRLIKDLPSWPDAKLVSEMNWLNQQLDALEREARRRLYGKPSKTARNRR
jgi:hypothetical protein